MKRLSCYIFFLLILTGPFLWAQSSQWSVGIRAGKSSGVSAKFYANDSFSTEILLTVREDGVQLTGLAIFEEGEIPLLDVDPQFFWYYGIGGHGGYYRYSRNVRDETGKIFSQRRTRAAVGLDGIIGMSWRANDWPVALSLDWKPYFDLFLPVRMSEGLFDFGITARYLF
ncbi:MAG: hypothetical protein AAF824_12090 [Bacteroidota bacterium]